MHIYTPFLTIQFFRQYYNCSRINSLTNIKQSTLSDFSEIIQLYNTYMHKQ